MIQKTRGIVINSFKQGESNLIARIYTEDFGLLSFFVHGARKSRSSRKQNIFQSLNCIEVVFYLKDTNMLQNIKEIRLISQHKSISFDMIKTSLVMFAAEVLKGCLKEQEKNPELFDFLLEKIAFLDNNDENLSTFHLQFMIELSKFLGFAPRNNFDNFHMKFDLQEGSYQPEYFNSPYCLSKEESRAFFNLQKLCSDSKIVISSNERKMLLYKLIDYYRLHVVGFKELVSPKILEEILH